jgi:N-acetylmannosamine-6-phosphate 2-epimerase/N-acetylmannosamine kinase
MPAGDLLERLRGGLIVSCQAPEGDAFRDADSMARFARAAIAGGAAGIRANGAEDIAAIRAAVSVPIIGIEKAIQADGEILITPSLEAARRVAGSGADIVALDCSRRGQRYGALERLREIRAGLGLPVMADVATLEEAQAAEAAGADLVASTLRGYTAETRHLDAFDGEFVAEWASALRVPLVVEGRIVQPAQAARAIAAGAFAVVVGTAITRPEWITRRFAEAIARASKAAACRCLLGIDLGGTNTKYGVVTRTGELLEAAAMPTPAGGGRAVLLEHLKRVVVEARRLAQGAGAAPSAVGIATAGWVDPNTGKVVYATENLPGWTGTDIAGELAPVAGVPVYVENDANALAVGEKHFGAARGASDFVSVTLGTGVGGGCYIGGQLNRGPHFFANGIGHMTLVFDGRPCTCGRQGCLEAYTNAAALLGYAAGRFPTAEALIRSAHAGDAVAREAVRTFARYLAAGLASVIQLLDTPLIILGGGLVENNRLLMEDLLEELPGRVTAWSARSFRLLVSPLGYYGGVLGAAAVAMERLCEVEAALR